MLQMVHIVKFCLLCGVGIDLTEAWSFAFSIPILRMQNMVRFMALSGFVGRVGLVLFHWWTCACRWGIVRGDAVRILEGSGTIYVTWINILSSTLCDENTPPPHLQSIFFVDFQRLASK